MLKENWTKKESSPSMTIPFRYLQQWVHLFTFIISFLTHFLSNHLPSLLFQWSVCEQIYAVITQQTLLFFWGWQKSIVQAYMWLWQGSRALRLTMMSYFKGKFDLIWQNFSFCVNKYVKIALNCVMTWCFCEEKISWKVFSREAIPGYQDFGPLKNGVINARLRQKSVRGEIVKW